MAKECAAIDTAPSGAMMMVETTMAPQMAISCAATGRPIFSAFFRISPWNLPFSFRPIRRSVLLRRQQLAAISRLTTAQAAAVPMPAPITPKCGMKIALNTTSNRHIAALSTLGVTISPLHCKNAEQSELSCENGTISANTIKYADASAQISCAPPSQPGRCGLSPTPVRHSNPDTISAATMPFRTTFRASSSFPAPM